MKLYFVGIVVIGWITIVCASATPPTVNPNWNTTWTDSLKRSLLANYDKFARPAHHLNVTNVEIGLTIRHIELDEIKSIFTVYGWIKMKWNDEKLKWNASDYGDLSVLHLADHEVWQPDIMLYNSATGSTNDHFGNTHLLVETDGTVLWVPPAQLPVFCQLDMRYWPYDTHKCQLVLGSWTYNGKMINLSVTTAEVNPLIDNNVWNMKEVTTHRNVTLYACCEEPYVDVSFHFKIERKSPMYETVVVSPATIIILITLATFWLPPLSGEKIFLNGITAILITVFLVYFSQKLPIYAVATPLIVMFYSTSLYLIAFSTIISVIVLNLAKNKQAYAIPWCLKTVLDGPIGTILLLNHLYAPPSQQQRAEELRENAFEDHTTSDDHHMIQPAKKGAIQHDWVLLATAIDRIAFLIYCFIFIILAIVYSV